MKVLITGGCGFLGSNIAASFLESGDKVTIIDALFRKGSEMNQEWLIQQEASGPAPTFHRVDLADEAAVNEVFHTEGPFDYVCHLGGQVAMTTSLSDPRRDMLTNVLGTFNVLEAVRAFCPDALVAYSSTNKVYGDLRDISYRELETRYTVEGCETGFPETLPLDFASPYGCSKGAADQYIRDWHRNYGLQTVVFRHSSIYGGRQFATFDQGWIGWFCGRALAQKADHEQGRTPEPFTISGTGKQVRDVLHADDLVRLYRGAYEYRETVNGRIYNIGGGMPNSLSLLELFHLLEELCELPQPLAFTRLPRRQSDQDFFVADISSIKHDTGWIPLVSAREGISRMLHWLQTVES